MMGLWILFFLIGLAFPLQTQAAGDIFAEVDGVAITAEEVEKPLGDS